MCELEIPRAVGKTPSLGAVWGSDGAIEMARSDCEESGLEMAMEAKVMGEFRHGVLRRRAVVG